ncbi:LysM peptidoglycan-binding domain-containing protein [Limosilactobacillus reuteri]|uniref:aggregation-promoting factor n=1 Tax=Limosilactobacillus reuteri TaxID=1598 RepID=UPI00111A57E9|nr:LysM peptidoglycan-binding domain-containing protein [Limosilactobacillus reuteri]
MKLTKNIAKITAAVAGAVALGTFATATTANADSVYTVQSGDTLSSISYKLGHDLTYVDSLASTNQIANKNLIYVGQKLVIKDDGEVTQATAQQAATLPEASQAPASASVESQQPSQAPVVASQAPVATSQVQSSAAPVSAPAQSQAPVQSVAAPQQSYSAPVQAQATSSNYSSNVSGNDAAAKAWIAARESGGSYSARNGQYVGKYQLSASYLNGDYSEANQERVADQYVANRYGSWSAAQSFWQSHGWY